MTRMEALAIAAIVLALISIIVFGVFKEYNHPPSSIVEIRNEHLIWEAPGCKVYQLVIKNEWGTHVLFITDRARKETPLRQADYPTCRVTR